MLLVLIGCVAMTPKRSWAHFLLHMQCHVIEVKPGHEGLAEVRECALNLTDRASHAQNYTFCYREKADKAA